MSTCCLKNRQIAGKPVAQKMCRKRLDKSVRVTRLARVLYPRQNLVQPKGVDMTKTRFLGTQEWMNPKTGELIEAHVVAKEAGDVGFHKIWLHEILSLIDQVGNAKTTVLMWLLANMDANNRVIATHQEIADATSTSTKSVSRLLAALVAADVIQQTHKSIWRLNPKVIFKGEHNKRMSILIKYREAGQADLFEEPAETEPASNVTPISRAA